MLGALPLRRSGIDNAGMGKKISSSLVLATEDPNPVKETQDLSKVAKK